MKGASVQILNFDDSVIKQKLIAERFKPAVIDLKSFSSQVRLWASHVDGRKIREILAESSRNAITFLGSGDFHHISSLLVEQFTEPVSVIIFDFHPDWDNLPPRLGCGSWVNRILEQPNVLKVILLGVSSSDISTFSLQSANLSSLENNRLEIYPYEHSPSRVFFKDVPFNCSLGQKKGWFSRKIYWQEMKGKDLKDFTLKLVNRLPSQKVYLSIDKDCLLSAFALTNWEEGLIHLDELLAMLKVIKERLEIVGLDITGEYSLPQIHDKRKDFFSRLDHPRKFSAKGKDEYFINSRNEKTNLQILELLLS